MKKIVQILLLFLAFQSFGQQYGNEWIDYSQTYYKFKVAETGIHRINYNVLTSIPGISTVNSSEIKIFAKQRELPIYINDGGDGLINDANDYIEFYGEKNNGWLDSLMYDNPNAIGNPFYSLINDTLNYFITWSNTPSKRFVEETDVNFAPHTPVDYLMADAIVSETSYYYDGLKSSGSAGSNYSNGEGYTSNHWNGASGGSVAKTVNLSGIYQGANAPLIQVKGRMSSNSSSGTSGSFNHQTTIRFGNATNDVVLLSESYSGYQSKAFSGTFSPALATNGNNFFYHDISNIGQNTDFQLFNFGTCYFPTQVTASNATYKEFYHEYQASGQKTFVQMTQVPGADHLVYVLGSENYKIPALHQAGLFRFLIPESSTASRQKIIVTNASQVKNVTQITPVNQTGTFVNYLTGNIDSLYLIVSETSILSSAQNYANYRSGLGGGLNTLLVDVNNLYDQFGGGITKHPLAIKRFAKKIFDDAGIKPVAVFLLGKGIIPNGGGYRTNTTSYNLCKIPSFGSPASDNLLTQGMNNSSSWSQDIPIGRISANSNEEVERYLTKVKAYENHQNQTSVYDKPSKEWQKKIMHFGGGNSLSEQNNIANKLSNYETIVEGQQFGGSVFTYLQQSSAPINPTILTELNDQIADGVSLMTFYGHAVADGFDINIDDPNNWNNFEKYPFVIGNSCYTGNIHLNASNSVSEKFVFTEDAGAIGMMSSVNLGFLEHLYHYTSRLYQQFSDVSYGNTIGYQTMKASEALESVFNGELYRQTSNQMTLHCDPMIRLNWHQKPEIDVTASDVFITPDDIDLSVSFFDVNVVLINLGKSITDTINLELTRTFPNGNGDTTFFQQITELHYKDTIVFTVPLSPNLSVGLNSFNFRADLPSFIDEQYDEFSNNQVTHNFNIKINGIAPVWPYNFAVLPYDTITVKGSTINPFASAQTYLFEIDTTDLFNSPMHRRASVFGLGGVKEVKYDEWRLASDNSLAPLDLEDSTVCFWRVALDSSVLVWQEHSFQYIKGKTGWGQDHFFQFKNNAYSQVNYERPTRKRTFETNPAELYCQVYGDGTDLYQTEWGINGQMQEYAICTWRPALKVAVIDGNLQAWENNSDGSNPDFFFGDAIGCRPWRREKFFNFWQDDPASMQAMRDMINNEVPDCHFVFIYAPVKAYYEHWTPADYAYFQSLGSTEIFDGQTNAPFITFFKKGEEATSFEEIHAVNADDFIELTPSVLTCGSTGTEVSPFIGPAQKWETLYWKQTPEELTAGDSTRLIIRAFANTGSEFLIDTLFSQNDSIIQLDNLIDATIYPMMQLEAHYADTVTGTPAQNDRWHVLYEPAPEMAIDGSEGYYFTITDSIVEGDDFKIAVDLVNISDYPMDSLLVHYYIEDANHNLHYLPYPRQDSLRVGQRITDTLTVNTFGYPGYNSIWIEANPYTEQNGTLKDQPEQYHFNNLAQVPFYVNSDNINPILDVTFDGNHIIDGDIVSPNSEIVITLKDENPLLVMNDDADTSKFGVFLTSPDGIVERIPFLRGGEPVMQWIPADASNLKFKIIYNGSFEKDGTYKLVVQGSDLSGNLSGDSEYRIHFEVIHESTITNLMNYPNPFSTSTKFVFTLTGSQVPDHLIIQIMSITGKVVREITMDELGPIKIGRNITEYAWDGKDMFGDQLANGVYMYRVLTELNGESIEHRSSGADQYFKKGFGKMYLMR